jgi:hypothetical protein
MSESTFEPSDSSDSESLERIYERERSYFRRELKSISIGDIAHKNGRHSYLNELEEEKLVTVLVLWSDIISQPKVKEIPFLV